LRAAFRDGRLVGSFWFVVLPALLFGSLSVLAPLRLSHLGFGSVAIGAVFLCTAAVEAVNNVLVGRLSDRRGAIVPILGGLAGSIAVAAALPWPTSRFALAGLIVLAGLAFGTFYTPAMTLLTTLSERRGLDYGYAFALVSLAWAPGQTVGAAGGGALAHATSDAVTYLALAVVCALTLLAAWRSRASIGSTIPSAPESSISSSHTTAAA
jgi:MFS family permease